MHYNTVLRAAGEAVLLGAASQRCRVHFLRNVLAQPDAEHVRQQLDTIAGMLWRQSA